MADYYGAVNALKKAGYSDEEVAQIAKAKGMTPPEEEAGKSLGGFASNVGKDLGANLMGLLQLPAMAQKVSPYSAITSPIETAKTIGNVWKGIGTEYKDLVTNPVETAYNKPISTIMDILPFFQAGKAAMGAKAGTTAKAGEAARLSGIGDIATETSRLNKVIKAPTTGVKSVGADFKSAVRGFESASKDGLFSTSKVKRLNAVADEFKLNGSAQNQLAQAENAFNNLSAEILGKLKKSNATVKTDTLINRLKNAWENDGLYDPSRQQMAAFNKITNNIKNKSKNGTLTYEDVFKTKQEIGRQYKGAFKESRANLREQDIVAKNMYGELLKAVDDGVPSVSNLTGKQSALFDIGNALDRQVGKMPLSVGAVTPKIPGVPRALQASSDALGRLLEFAGTGTESLASKTKNAAASGGQIRNAMPTELATILGRVSGQQNTGTEQAATATQGVQAAQPIAQTTTQPQMPANEWTVNRTEKPSGMSKEALTILTMADPENADQYKMLYDLQNSASSGKSLPAGQVKDIADTDIAINLLGSLKDDMGKYSSVIGPVTGNLAKLNPYSSKAQTFDALATQVKQIIGKGLEGGVLRKEDEYKYEQILPKITDTPKVIENKLELLNNTLARKKEITNQVYQKYGYSTGSDNTGTQTSDIDTLMQLLGQ